MSEASVYESRTGSLSCTTGEAFRFITDLRNFRRFVREGTFTNWMAEKESCSFSVPMMGKVSLRLLEKLDGKRVIYQGDALSKNDFTICVDISENKNGQGEVKISLSASLNPFMKTIADKPIREFMEKLIEEIENFRDWNELTE